MDIIYSLTKEEVLIFTKYGEASARLKSFWNDFISKMPLDLRLESINKGFTLIPLTKNVLNAAVDTYNLKFSVPDASKKLENFLEASKHNVIICR